MIKLDFNKWLPDGDPKVGDMVECNNLIPYDGKLMPFYGANPISAGAISGTTGLVLFYVYDPASNNKSFVGTNDKIYRLDSTTLTDVSKAGGYTVAASNTWDWTVYEDNLIMTTAGLAPQRLSDIDAGANFADLGGSPTASKCCAMYKDHLFLGNQTSYPRRVQISAQGDITDYVASTATGAGTIDMPSFGEQIVALKPIGDYLAVYMTNSIYLIDFIGPPLWFSASRIQTGVGLLSMHSVAAIDKSTHVFLGKKDIYIMAAGQIQPTGVGVRRRVLNNIDLPNAHLITHLVDRAKKCVMWLYPSTSGDDTPDSVLIFNYEEGRFSEADYAAHCVGNVLSPTMTINGLDSYFATIDDVGTSFDDASWSGGDDYNGVVADSDKKLSALNSATPLTGTLETGEVDLETVHMIKQLRPIIERAQGTVTMSLKHRYDDNDSYTTTSSTTNANGLADIRATGRYHKLRMVVTGDHSGIRGCKIDHVQTGQR